MSIIELPVTTHRTRDTETSAYSGWLLRVFPESGQSSILLRAVILSVAILGLEYLVEVEWRLLDYWPEHNPSSYWLSRGFHDLSGFFSSPDIVLSAVGLVFTLTLLGQWGARYVELWEDVRPAFRAENEQYDAVIGRNLAALYGRDYVPFLVFALVQLGVYGVFHDGLPAGFFHIGFLQFFAVMALYLFYRHTIMIREVTAFDLVGVARARPTLTRVVDFGVVVGTIWFVALTPLAVWLVVFLGVGSENSTLTDLSFGRITVTAELFYGLMVLFLVVVGLLIFTVPMILLHEALAAAKHERLQEIGADYEALFEDWREGNLGDDPSIGLDILEKRRENAEALSTWPYRIVSVSELVFASIVPAALSLVKVIEELSKLLSGGGAT